jgi:hypothetical protein
VFKELCPVTGLERVNTLAEVERLLAHPTALSDRVSTNAVDNALDRAWTFFREIKTKGVCFGELRPQGKLLNDSEYFSFNKDRAS